jgi:hypothetical protein
MRIRNRVCTSVLGAAAVLTGLSASGANGAALKFDAATTGADTVPVTWQRHHMTFNYFGITVLYSCDALERQVGRILTYLGARSDLKVTASGCPRGPESPSHNAWVDADFYVPVPASDASNTSAASTAKARWTPVDLTPSQPYFMGKGDCELVQGMKDLVTKGFAMRGLDYSTSCFPGELTNDGFVVRGDVLKVMQLKSS